VQEYAFVAKGGGVRSRLVAVVVSIARHLAADRSLRITP